MVVMILQYVYWCRVGRRRIYYDSYEMRKVVVSLKNVTMIYDTLGAWPNLCCGARNRRDAISMIRQIDPRIVLALRRRIPSSSFVFLDSMSDYADDREKVSPIQPYPADVQ
jgi:hypothetical protein